MSPCSLSLSDGDELPAEIGYDHSAVGEHVDAGVLFAHFIVKNDVQVRVKGFAAVGRDDIDVFRCGIHMGAGSVFLLPFQGMAKCTDDSAVLQLGKVGKRDILLVPVNGFMAQNLHDPSSFHPFTPELTRELTKKS